MTDAEKVTVPAITVGDAVVVCAVFVFAVIIRALAHCEAALRLVVQHHDELRSIVGLAVKRLVRDDNRGSRQSGRRDAVEHILRNGDTVKRVLGIVAAIDRDRSPAQPPVIGARHRREHMRTDAFVRIAAQGNDWNGAAAPVSLRPEVNKLRREGWLGAR